MASVTEKLVSAAAGSTKRLLLPAVKSRICTSWPAIFQVRCAL
jgi:hypothetical protein